jgi:hypothetical protein
VVGAVVWPVFLFVAVEILARTSWPHGWSWHLLRWAGLVPVAGVAAFVSYRHLSGLLAHYGEDGIVTIVGPLAVDGLMIMATGALIAGGRARSMLPAPVVPAPTVVEPTKTLTTPVAPVSSPSTPATRPVSPAPLPVTPTTAPPPVPTGRSTRVPPTPKPTPAKPTPTRAATDSSVTAPAPVTRQAPAESGLLRRARHAAESHRREHGNGISAGELATRLRVREGLARNLLTELEKSTNPTQGSPTVHNNTVVETATR